MIAPLLVRLPTVALASLARRLQQELALRAACAVAGQPSPNQSPSPLDPLLTAAAIALLVALVYLSL